VIDLYVELDLPAVPTTIEQLCINACNSKPLMTIFREGFIARKQCTFSTYQPPLELISWLHGSKIEYKDVFIQKSYNGTHLHPHIDGSKYNDSDQERDWATNYLLTSSEPITSWYTSDRVQIMSKQIPSKIWHRIKTSILHGVTDINEPRISISLI
jgi:hypothetical protein